MIDNGAEYLYSDSDEIVANMEIAFCLDTLILEKGTMMVFGLKTPHQNN